MPRRRADPLIHRRTLRLTEAEEQRLNGLVEATGRSASDVIRSLIRGGPALRPASPRKSIWDQKALAELARIGNNINQIARELNRRERMGVDATELERLDKALLQVVMVTMAGPEAAKQVILDGLTRFMESAQVGRFRGPTEPTREPR